MITLHTPFRTTSADEHRRRYLEGDKPRQYVPFKQWASWNVPLSKEVLEMEDMCKKYADKIIESIRKNAISAIQKDHVSELTEEEKSAVCYYCGVPSRFDMETRKTIFEPCALAKIDGKWIAAMKA